MTRAGTLVAAAFIGSAVSAVSAVGAVSLAGAQAPAAPVAAASAWDGVFTDAQADRGEREYGRTCSHCHGLSLEGDGSREIPTLVSDAFMRHWRGRSVQALFDTLMRSMPADDRGSLTPGTTADLIAYLLRANGAQGGGMTLPANREALAALVIGKAETP